MYCFNKPLDEISSISPTEIIKGYYFTLKWYEVYSLIEFIANQIDAKHPHYEDTSTKFIEACNTVLKHEVSAYRFIGKKLIPVTSEEEITEIEKAIHTSKQFTQHLDKALELFSNKKTPDYTNTIKEAISAVEAICKLIIDDPKATLGMALDRLEKTQKIDMHEKLKSAFKNLYGYTSDAQGIRHGFIGKANLDVEDARFMLIACSAFINYLKVKADKAEIQLFDK